MPAQILDRQPDTQGEAIRSITQTQNDMLGKIQSLKIAQMEASIRAKTVTNEAEANKLTRTAQMYKVMEDGLKSGLAQNPKWMQKMHGLYGNEFFDGLESLSKDYYGGQGNPEVNLQRAQTEAAKADVTRSTAQAEDYLSQAEARREALKDPGAAIRSTMETIRGLGGSEGVPVGTTINQKLPDGSSMAIPINPQLPTEATESVARGLSVQEVAQPIMKALNTGIFGKDPAERTSRQLAVENPYAIFSSGDQNLANFRSAYNVIRRISLFDEAGKALTGTEKVEAERLLELKGKSDETIKKDLAYLIEKNQKKLAVILGGSSAAKSLRGGGNIPAQGASRFVITPVGQ